MKTLFLFIYSYTIIGYVSNMQHLADDMSTIMLVNNQQTFLMVVCKVDA